MAGFFWDGAFGAASEIQKIFIIFTLFLTVAIFFFP